MNEYQFWVKATNQSPRLGDRVLVGYKMGHVTRVNLSHVQVLLISGDLITYPKEMVDLRNDLL